LADKLGTLTQGSIALSKSDPTENTASKEYKANKEPQLDLQLSIDSKTKDPTCVGQSKDVRGRPREIGHSNGAIEILKDQEVEWEGNHICSDH
jgi:hypothetical protein